MKQNNNNTKLIGKFCTLRYRLFFRYKMLTVKFNIKFDVLPAFYTVFVLFRYKFGYHFSVDIIGRAECILCERLAGVWRGN